MSNILTVTGDDGAILIDVSRIDYLGYNDGSISILFRYIAQPVTIGAGRDVFDAIAGAVRDWNNRFNVAEQEQEVQQNPEASSAASSAG